jgi:hypothetical protein
MNPDIDINNNEEIINTDVNVLLESFWYEKWIEIIRQHFLEEINNYRLKNNRPLLELDSSLNLTAQKFAEYWSKNEWLWHSPANKSVQNMF